MRVGDVSVYFIQEGKSGPVKIGYIRSRAFGNGQYALNARLSNLQVGNPRMLKCLGIIDGDRGQELIVHEQFARHRIRSEWFKPHASLLAFIRANVTQVAPKIKRTLEPLARPAWHDELRRKFAAGVSI